MNNSIFKKQHYNVIAAQYKKQFARYETRSSECGAIITACLDMTKRLKLHNPQFDPIKFLDMCSPDPELFPLSELWTGLEVLSG